LLAAHFRCYVWHVPTLTRSCRWYTRFKYEDPPFKRLSSVSALGLDKASSSNGDTHTEYEPDELLCEDVRAIDSAWLEVHWKFDAFAHALAANPYTRDEVRELLSPNDLYGPLARHLLQPADWLARKIDAFAERYFERADTLVVGVDLQRGQELRKVEKCLQSIGLQPLLDGREPDWELLGDERLRRRAPKRVLLFVTSAHEDFGDIDDMRRRYGEDTVVVFEDEDIEPSRAFANKYTVRWTSDEKQLANHFLMQRTDVVVLSRHSRSARLLHASRRPLLLSADGRTCSRSLECGACFAWANATRSSRCRDEVRPFIEQHNDGGQCEKSLFYKW